MDKKFQVDKKIEKENYIKNALMSFIQNILEDNRIHMTVRKEYRNNLIEVLENINI